MEADLNEQRLKWEPTAHLIATYVNAHRGDKPAVTTYDVLPPRLKVQTQGQSVEDERELRRQRMERMKAVAKMWNQALGGQDLSGDPKARREWVDQMNAASVTPNPIMETGEGMETGMEKEG